MIEKQNVKRIDFLTNVIYLTALAMDIMLRESESMLRSETPPSGWRQEKKRMFSQYLDYVKKACVLNDQLISQDIYDIEEKNDYKYVSVWQEEANELARSILMIADRQSNCDSIDKIHSFIRQTPGDGIADEELLKRFYLKKI